MRVIALCQGGNLGIFSELVRITAEEIGYEHLGVFVADVAYVLKWGETHSFGQSRVTWLREWESVRAGLVRSPDLGVIRRFEQELGAPSLWSGILADRRLIFGRFCKTMQDYRPRYTDTQLLGVLTEALLRVDQLFRDVDPEMVFGFVPVTLHEYLILRVALARGVPVRLLRSTKIENFVSLNDALFGLSGHISARFGEAEAEVDPRVDDVVDRYLQKTRQRGAVYEGMHLSDHALRRFRPLAAARGIAAGCLHEIRRQLSAEIRQDPHNPGYLVPALAEHVLQPFRAARARRIIAREGLERLGECEYCLFPLHFEPEIALQIYARPLQNQIEVARTIALALPAGMKLVVKEHPRAAGFRPADYYRKLLDIPGVILVEPERQSCELVRGARLVTVITGNVGLEAVAMGKPVVVLGQTDYSVLPPHMLRTCHNLFELSREIQELLAAFRPDEAELRRYLSSVVAGAVPIDLYSVLLGKGGRHGFSSGGFGDDLNRLKTYVISRFTSARPFSEAKNV